MINKAMTFKAAEILKSVEAVEKYRNEVFTELLDACEHLLSRTGGMDRQSFEKILPFLQRITEACKHARLLTK